LCSAIIMTINAGAVNYAMTLNLSDNTEVYRSEPDIQDLHI